MSASAKDAPSGPPARKIDDRRRAGVSPRPERASAGSLHLYQRLITQLLAHRVGVELADRAADDLREAARPTLSDRGVLIETTGKARSRVWQHRGIFEVLDDYTAGIRRMSARGVSG